MALDTRQRQTSCLLWYTHGHPLPLGLRLGRGQGAGGKGQGRGSSGALQLLSVSKQYSRLHGAQESRPVQGWAVLQATSEELVPHPGGPRLGDTGYACPSLQI